MFYSNRGMHLESLINYTIEKYNFEKIALIFKSSIPLIINNKKHFYTNKGTVDYHGVFRGKYLCFEAKSTQGKYLPWKNLKEHQWNYLTTAYNLDAVSFIIIYFSLFDSYHLVFTKNLIKLKSDNQKVTWKWVNKKGYKIEFTYPFLLDFIKFI